MIGAILAAVTGLIGAGLQSRAASEANQINWENLRFQKENAREGKRLSTASRTDVYGNELDYDEILNEWMTKLTPEQQRIIKGMEREQTLSLTEDAPRNRDFRRRQDERSKQADDDYDQMRARYLYEEPEDEGVFEAEGIQDMILSRTGRTKDATNQLARGAVRTGNSGMLPVLLKQASDLIGGSLPESIARGRAAGRGAYREATAAHENRFRPAMGMFENTANRGGNAAIQGSDLPQRMDARQVEMLRAISAAIGNEAAQVGGASSELSEGIRRSAPDLSGIASALAGLNFGGGSNGSDPSFTAPFTDPYKLGNDYNLDSRIGSTGVMGGVNNIASGMASIFKPKDDFLGLHGWRS